MWELACSQKKNPVTEAENQTLILLLSTQPSLKSLEITLFLAFKKQK